MDTFTTSAATSDDSTKLLLSLAKAGENQPSTNKRTMTDDPAELDRIQEQLRFEKEQQRRVAKKTPQPETEPTVRRLTKYPVGTKLRKKFPGYGTFNGTIISSDHVYYQIKYEDSDTEEMAEDEIAQYLVRRPSSRPAKKAKKTVTTWQRTDLLWTSQNLDPHTLHFTVGDLDAATTHRLADFFLFVYERQMIWVRRARGDPAPWTQVPRLQTSNFCNVYRELDRGTTLLHAHLVKLWWYHHNDRPHTARDWTFTVLWTAYSYRLVNRVGTFQKTGFPNLHTVRPFLQSCQKLWQQGEKVFTAAHQTNGWERYSRWMKTMAAQNGQPIAKVVDTLLQVTTVQACLEALEELPGVSRFMSWQLWCDLRESRCLLGVTKDVDTYCLLGPGAQKGLNLIFGKASSNDDYLEMANGVVQLSDAVYQSLGLTFPKWNGKDLTLKEIEHALCEYQKLTAPFSKASRRSGRPAENSAEKKCFQCSASGRHGGKCCDLCWNFYCKSCPESMPMDDKTPSFICDRCRAFEKVTFAS